MKRKTLFLLISLLFLVGLLVFSGNIYALTIDPLNSPSNPAPLMTGDQNNTDDILDFLDANLSGFADLQELYKDDLDDGESGPLLGDYETEYLNSPTDPADAIITYVGDTNGPSSIAQYLLVKDGNQSPAWYLYDLAALQWDGMETIYLNNFWPGKGAISHVALYGAASVPEPATLFLLGTGLIGTVVVTRRKIRK